MAQQHIPAPGAPPSRAERRRVANNVPQSPEVAEQNLATVIGQSVAAHLGQVLAQMPWHPACIFCVAAHKRAAAEASPQAGEEPQAAPELPPIAQAITWMPVPGPQGQPPCAVPVCYPHCEAQAGPGVRQTGLVLPDGRPIVATG